MDNSIMKSNNAGLQKTGNSSSSVNSILSKPAKANPYTAQITRNAPTAFVFLLDQSGSMSETVEYAGSMKSKAECLSEIVNTLLTEMIFKCVKGHDVYHYYDIAIVGYGGDRDDEAYLLWEGDLEGMTWVSPEELYNNPICEEEVDTVVTIRGNKINRKKTIKKWIEPEADGLTPMGSAFDLAYELLKELVENHKNNDCFPPSVFNISDGAVTDVKEDEMLEKAKKIKQLSTTDGNTLLFNLHISDSDGSSIIFPSNDSGISDAYGQLLFDMASDMPKIYHAEISTLTKRDATVFKALAFNAGMDEFVKMLSIGTRTNSALE